MQYNRYPSTPPRGRRRRRVKVRFFLFLLVFLGLIALGIWGIISLFSKGGTYTIGYGRLEKDSRADALLMRQEESVGLASYSKVQYTATENQNVNAGDVIMTTYSQGYASTYVTRLEEIRAEIATLQDAAVPSGIRDSNIERFDTLIAEKTDQITSFSRGERQGVRFVDLERDLRDLLVQRLEYIRVENNVSSNARLNELYQEEKEAEIKIQSWMTVHTAMADGRVSYQFDGYEYVLKPEYLSALDAATVSELLKGTAAPTVPPEEKDTALPPMYRIVTPDEWYTLMIVQEKDWSFAENTRCDISFVGYEDIPYSATVRSVTSDGVQALVVLSMTEDIGKLINERKVTAILGGRVEGLIVPSKALKENGTQMGVYLEDGQTFIPVQVKGKDDYGFYLVESSEEGALAPGMKVRAR